MPFKILFYCAKPYSLAVTAVLRQLCRSFDDSHYRVFGPPAIGRKITEDPFISDLGEAAAFKPHYVLCPGNYVHDAIGGIRVQLFHGLCIEKPGHYRIRGFFQVYCTPGPEATGQFEKLARRHHSFLVRETGWPKLDLLCGPHAAGTPRPSTLPRDRKIILYAPTFSRRLTSVPRLLPLLPTLARDDEFFVIKPHDLHDPAEVTALAALSSRHCMLVRDPDITPWLHAADILLSDTSSVVYEFALRSSRIVLVDPLRKDLPWTSCRPEGVRRALDAVHAADPAFSPQATAWMQKLHPYRDGQSSERVLALLRSPEFHAQAAALPRKKNLFRRLKLRYYDTFRKGYVK